MEDADAADVDVVVVRHEGREDVALRGLVEGVRGDVDRARRALPAREEPPEVDPASLAVVGDEDAPGFGDGDRADAVAGDGEAAAERARRRRAREGPEADLVARDEVVGVLGPTGRRAESTVFVCDAC